MTERSAGHYRKRHGADGADRQRVQSCRRREHIDKAVEAKQQQAQGEPAIADMQDQQQRLRESESPRQRDRRSATVIPAASAAHAVRAESGAIVQISKASPVTTSAARSKR